MLKEDVVESMGEAGLLLPTRIKAALAANDRLKLRLSVVQAAIQHAEHPKRDALDLSREQAAAGLREAWMDEMLASAARGGEMVFLPGLPLLCRGAAADLAAMAKALGEGEAASALRQRAAHWVEWLDAVQDESLSNEDVARLTRGDRDHGDGVHLVVMDMHKQLNRVAAALASEEVDGAHTWNLAAPDRALVAAFMRGLHRTAGLKFDHPGLDTAATRDGARLLLQNDIGTNDAHVLVMHVADLNITLTYSDLHQSRFEFFRDQLAAQGASWSVVEPRVTPGLNMGAAYFVGTASFACADADAVAHTLQEIGARIVFLIDWNRARKRLQLFVSKPAAIAVLNAAAALEVGHMAWLKAGGEKLLYSVMQAVGDGIFRLGDRLDGVLGGPAAQQFLVDALALASRALLDGRPLAQIEDETRVLLTRQLRDWASEFELAGEHAAYCHELAMALRDLLAHGAGAREAAAAALRAKNWERRADDLVEQGRAAAKRHQRWGQFARLLELADDVADELEEAIYLLALIVEEHEDALRHGVRQALQPLAEGVLEAVENYVKALALAATLSHGAELDSSDAFLDATWRVVLAERACDEQLRAARRLILKELTKAAEMTLAGDLAGTIERASDALMVASFALRELVLARTGAVA